MSIKSTIAKARHIQIVRKTTATSSFEGRRMEIVRTALCGSTASVVFSEWMLSGSQSNKVLAIDGNDVANHPELKVSQSKTSGFDTTNANESK